MRTHRNQIRSYTTKDGSSICELMHPDFHANSNQSMAEATIPPGTQTELHLHKKSEEIYHITHGEGWMSLGEDQFSVNVGDTICILPNTPHQISNVGKDNLVFICACSPAYTHDDTVLIQA